MNGKMGTETRSNGEEKKERKKESEKDILGHEWEVEKWIILSLQSFSLSIFSFFFFLFSFFFSVSPLLRVSVPNF